MGFQGQSSNFENPEGKEMMRVQGQKGLQEDVEKAQEIFDKEHEVGDPDKMHERSDLQRHIVWARGIANSPHATLDDINSALHLLSEGIKPFR